MTVKFPIWIYIVLGLQLLGCLALALFVFIMGSAYDGVLEPHNIALIVIISVTPIICVWLARSQWQAGRYNPAKVLAIAPALLFVALYLVLALVMAR